MNAFKQNPVLISILLIIVVLKFCVLPIFNWQNEAMWEIEQKNKRLHRSELAVMNLELNKDKLSKLVDRVSIEKSLFYKPQEESQFKLEQQQFIDQLVNKYNFKANNIGWSNTSKVLDKPIIRHHMAFSLEGDVSLYPSFHAELESQKHWIGVDNFSIDFLGQKAKKLGRFRGRIELDFYQYIN